MPSSSELFTFSVTVSFALFMLMLAASSNGGVDDGCLGRALMMAVFSALMMAVFSALMMAVFSALMMAVFSALIVKLV